MKPRYEIHSIGLPDIVEPAGAAQRDRAARALFSATEIVRSNRFETEVGRSVPRTKYAEYAGRYQTHFLAQMRRLAESLSRAYAQNRDQRDLTKFVARMKSDAPELRDAWESRLRVTPAAWAPRTTYMVQSAGPDKRFDTDDDLTAYLEVRTGKLTGRREPGTIDLDI